MADAELKEKVIEWFQKKSTGEKKKFYLKDVVKAMVADGFEKKPIQKAVNELIEEDRLMWFSTGSTNMITLPEFFKG